MALRLLKGFKHAWPAPPMVLQVSYQFTFTRIITLACIAVKLLFLYFWLRFLKLSLSSDIAVSTIRIHFIVRKRTFFPL